MRRWERIGLETGFWLVTASGLLYGWFRYFGEHSDPFAVVGHPWESIALHTHVLTAPALIFFFAIALRGHALEKIRQGYRNKRTSGLLILVTFLVSAAAGYGLQAATAPQLHTVLMWLHLGPGLLCVLLLPVHVYLLHTKQAETKRTDTGYSCTKVSHAYPPLWRY